MKSNPIFNNFKLFPLLHLILQKKWKIFIFSTLCTCFGVWIAYNIPNEYTSQVQILPELEIKEGTESMNNFKSLAGLAGVDLSSFGSTEAVRPDLYPNILQSTPFLMQLLHLKVRSIEHQREMLVSDYLKECSKKEILVKLVGESNKSEFQNLNEPKITPELIHLNKEEDLQIRELHKRVVTSLDKKTGVITMSVKMQDPVIAATLAKFTQDYLLNYVIQYRTEKTQKDIDFLSSRINEAQKHYEKALFAYSHYQDMNRNLFLNIAKDEGKKLQHEVELAYNLYTQLATQLEETKIRIHRETPVFKVLEPAQVPVKKSSPSRGIIIVGFTLLGLFISVVGITVRNFHFSEVFKA
ncbi:capsular polysaccharide biosynthesis protein [Arcicella rosea]|uniref:GNVR domain-containing protein n=1 Tax=Arcicella rosea TaxID=502909 RepID=UPI00345DF943